MRVGSSRSRVRAQDPARRRPCATRNLIRYAVVLAVGLLGERHFAVIFANGAGDLRLHVHDQRIDGAKGCGARGQSEVRRRASLALALLVQGAEFADLGGVDAIEHLTGARGKVVIGCVVGADRNDLAGEMRIAANRPENRRHGARLRPGSAAVRGQQGSDGRPDRPPALSVSATRFRWCSRRCSYWPFARCGSAAAALAASRGRSGTLISCGGKSAVISANRTAPMPIGNR